MLKTEQSFRGIFKPFWPDGSISVLLTIFIMLFVLTCVTVEAKPLRVALCDNPPLSFIDDKGLPQGIFVDILEAIGEKEKLEFEYVKGSWSDSLDRLYSKDCDILPAIAYAEWREKRVDFGVETVFSNWGKVCARSGVHVNSFLDFEGLTVAVMGEDIYFVHIVKLLSSFGVKCKFLSLKSYKDALAAVAERQADVAVVSRFSNIDEDLDGLVSATPIVFAPIELRFGFAKGTDKNIINAFDRIVLAMKSDNKSIYYTSVDRWVGSSSSARRGKSVWTVAVVGVSVLLVGFVFVFLAARDRIRSGKERRQGDRRITESRRAEDQAIDDAKDLAYELLQGIGDAIVLVGVEDQKIKHTCGGFYNLFGFENESIKGSDFSRLAEDDVFESHISEFSKLRESRSQDHESRAQSAESSCFNRLFNFNAVHSCGHVFEVEASCSVAKVAGEQVYIISLRKRT
jgi:ABC-type amino acid transport substrate-binding protein